jgi:hypothetical protein
MSVYTYIYTYDVVWFGWGPLKQTCEMSVYVGEIGWLGRLGFQVEW